METKEKIVEKISIDKEILSTFPKNNKKNADIYLEEIEKTYSRYNQIKIKIAEEFELRKNKYLRFKPNSEIPVINKRMIELEYKISMLEKRNTAFEKTGLDKIIYDISKYYKNNLLKVNSDIYSAIKVFKMVGVELSKDDFTYSDHAREYMTSFFEEKEDLSSEKLKHVFEKIYWKKPNIIKHIQLNLRKLYYDNIELFEQFCEKEVISFSEGLFLSKQSTCEEYQQYKEMYDRLNNQSEALYINKFSEKILDINNFSAKKIFDLYKVFTDQVEIDEHTNLSIVKLNKTLVEYKNYFKFKFIVDNVKEIFSKEKEKDDTSKKKLAEIKKQEALLSQRNVKKGIFNFKKKAVDEDKLIDELMNMYNDLDDVIFREKIAEFIKDDSKISDILELASSYFIYIARLLKGMNPEIKDEEIYDMYESLKIYLINEHKLISNLIAFVEHDMAMIISDKYKLDNLKVTIEMLKQDNIDNLINQTNQLIIYYNISKLRELSITEIDEYLKLVKKTSEIASK